MTPAGLARSESKRQPDRTIKPEIKRLDQQEQKYKTLSDYLLNKYGASLTVIETATELKVSKDLIYDLTNKGIIPSKKLGDRRIISSVDLAIFMLERDRS